MRALINTEKKLIKEKNLDSDLPVFRLLCLLGEFSLVKIFIFICYGLEIFDKLS